MARMEVLLYTLSGIFLYLLADAALDRIEALHGEPIPYRNVIFFVIIFLMAVILFQLIRMAYSPGA